MSDEDTLQTSQISAQQANLEGAKELTQQLVMFNRKLTIALVVFGLISLGFWGHMYYQTQYGNNCLCYGVKINPRTNAEGETIFSCRGIAVNCFDSKGATIGRR